MNGKGDRPRPVDREKYERGWEKVFGRCFRCGGELDTAMRCAREGCRRATFAKTIVLLAVATTSLLGCDSPVTTVPPEPEPFLFDGTYRGQIYSDYSRTDTLHVSFADGYVTGRWENTALLSGAKQQWLFTGKTYLMIAHGGEWWFNLKADVENRGRYYFSGHEHAAGGIQMRRTPNRDSAGNQYPPGPPGVMQWVHLERQRG